jgi:hypothetical protein
MQQPKCTIPTAKLLRLQTQHQVEYALFVLSHTNVFQPLLPRVSKKESTHSQSQQITMQGRGPKPEPLTGHPRYEKVKGISALLGTAAGATKQWYVLASCRVSKLLTLYDVCMQVRDLNSGTFGFVQLARDKQTGELIACKFIERGDKVCLNK